MNAPTKFILNAIGIVVAFVAGLTILFGWSSFVEAVGGLRSLGGLIALVVMAAIFIATLLWLMMHDYRPNAILDAPRLVRDLSVSGFLIVILAAIGWNWVELPEGTGWKAMGVIAVLLVMSAIMTQLGRVDEA